MTDVSLPKAKTIGAAAFYECPALEEISLPSATTLGCSAFYNCTALSELSFAELSTIEYKAFYGCTSLTEVSLPSVTTVGYAAFAACSYLTKVELASVTTLGTSTSSTSYGVFSECTRLQSVSLPSLSVVYDPTFYSCYMLSDLEIASAEGVELTWFGTSEGSLLSGMDLSYMTLTTNDTNESMVDGKYFTAPAYVSGSTYNPYVYADQTYGPFKEIIVKRY